MSKLLRSYLFSDTFGSPSANPLERIDPDAVITTDFRSQIRESVRREFDIYHDSEQTAHLLRMIFELDSNAVDEYRSSFRETYLSSTIGILINVAPRNKKGSNGEPFYIATARNGRIRVVTTPIDALAPIKHEIETLEHLPNVDNNLYGNNEQFRSSYTPALLYPDHGYTTVAHDNTADVPDPRSDWHVAYVDRFGNVITNAGSSERNRINAAIEEMQDEIKLNINNVEYGPYSTADSLAKAVPGVVSIYSNGNIDIARKWQPNESPAERLEHSAYVQLGRPHIGSRIYLKGIE
ncbi:hypothetical protein H6770_04605 [Candidatus Peribacteria bacterium]|nr:hypothetical protein [Candidatus Peribacteria bacterium]